MTTIEQALTRLRADLAQCAVAHGRAADAVRLLAVTKTFGADVVRAAAAAGQRDMGENYIQEALDKMAQLADLPLTWHCIGPIQSNKTRGVAEHFDWVHTVDRLKVAERLSAQRPEAMAPLNICLQVNVDGGVNKSGVAPDEVLALARAVHGLPRLRLRGLMTIPEPQTDPAMTLAVHQRTRDLFEQVKADLGAPADFDTLSMGMSGDWRAAVAAGSTLVRIGSAIFGQRPPKANAESA